MDYRKVDSSIMVYSARFFFPKETLLMDMGNTVWFQPNSREDCGFPKVLFRFWEGEMIFLYSFESSSIS